MGYLYKTSGEIISIAPKNGKKYTLSELQSYVGGFIDIIEDYEHIDENNLTDIIIINDEGKCVPDWVMNTEVTKKYGHLLFAGDVFAGDIVVIKSNEID